MHLSLTGEQELLRLRFARVAQPEIFVHQFVNGLADLVFVTSGLRLDREGNDRLDPLHGRIGDLVALLCKRVSGCGVLQLCDGADVAGVKLRDLNERLALNRRDLSKSFRHALVDVVRLSIGSQNTGIHAEQRNSSGERIGKRLEDECGERLVVGDLACDFCALRVLAGDGASRDGVRQVVHDRIQELRNTDVCCS